MIWITITNTNGKDNHLKLVKFHMIREDRPNFSDSGFSDGFSGVFTAAMSELE